MKVGEGAPPSFLPVILTVVSAPVVFGTGTVQKVFKGVGWCCWWEAVTRFLFVLPQNWKKLDVGTCWRQEIHPAVYILMASPSCYYLCHLVKTRNWHLLLWKRARLSVPHLPHFLWPQTHTALRNSCIHGSAQCVRAFWELALERWWYRGPRVGGLAGGAQGTLLCLAGARAVGVRATSCCFAGWDGGWLDSVHLGFIFALLLWMSLLVE